MDSSLGTSTTQTPAKHREVGATQAHKYFTYTKSAKSEEQLLLAPKSYEFYATEDEARRSFEREPRCESGYFFEVGWGGLRLFLGMTDWRRIEVAGLRKGMK